MSRPGYLDLLERGALAERVDEARAAMSSCLLCPRHCEVDRLHEFTGVCRVGREARVGSSGPHPGEESCLAGLFGSGTIFFSGCNLRCVFCKNDDFSLEDHGYPATPEHLADTMLSLQRQGCPNLNLVTPSHVVPQILEALLLAAESGLRLPVVYNSSGYDAQRALYLLDGVVDIYMPDFKFWNEPLSERYGHAPDYPSVARAALREMHRQVGDLVLDDLGLATRGLIVRHLLLPGCEEDTREILRFLAEEISPGTALNLMGHYHPNYRENLPHELRRAVPPAQVERAQELAREFGLTHLL